MVEATIYMPIVILTIVAILSLGMEMHNKISMQVDRHSEIRKANVGRQADFARKADLLTWEANHE